MLCIVAVAGLLAVLSPRWFAFLVKRSNTWVDSDGFFRRLDRRVEVDRCVLHNCRWFGVVCVAAAVLLGLVVLPMFSVQWIAWLLLGLVGTSGLVALASPPLFARLASFSSTWIDSDKFLKRLDRRVDVDNCFIRHSRLFGAVCVAVAVVLTIFLHCAA